MQKNFKNCLAIYVHLTIFIMSMYLNVCLKSRLAILIVHGGGRSGPRICQSQTVFVRKAAPSFARKLPLRRSIRTNVICHPSGSPDPDRLFSTQPDSPAGVLPVGSTAAAGGLCPSASKFPPAALFLGVLTHVACRATH
jgi:hypothetical protein